MEIEVSRSLSEFFNTIWQLFDIYIPFIGMKISHFVIGFFVVMVGIKIYNEFFKGEKQ